MIKNDKFPKNLQRTGKQQQKSSSRHALGFAGHVKIFGGGGTSYFCIDFKKLGTGEGTPVLKAILEAVLTML